MPPLRPSSTRVAFAFAFVAAAAPVARADGGGVQVGARAGIQLLDEDAATVGADVRLSFELSPLTVSLTFDHFFVEDETLFQVGANALYDLPVATSAVSPYVGAGIALTRFAIPETAGGEDSNGMRIGLNLIAGIRFEHEALPVARPFAQVMWTAGPIDLFTVGGGVLFEVAGG